MIYSENGVNSDPEKLKNLQNILYQTHEKELQEFFGIITYLSPFIPDLLDKTHTLRGLLKKDIPFFFQKNITRNVLKTVINPNATLTYLNTILVNGNSILDNCAIVHMCHRIPLQTVFQSQYDGTKISSSPLSCLFTTIRCKYFNHHHSTKSLCFVILSF